MRVMRNDEEWARVDSAIKYMVPEGFSSTECSEATGLPRAQLIRRANMLDLPFSAAFGPQSKCRAGHLLKKHGFDMVYSDRSQRGTRRCKTCHQRNLANSSKLRRKRRGTPEPVPRSRLVRAGDNATQRTYRAALATNAILLLGEQIDREPRKWMRLELEQQLLDLQISLRGATQ